MNQKDLCEHTRIPLIAAAIGHQQCTATDGTEVLIPGTDKRILIGSDAYLAKVAGRAASVPAAQAMGADGLLSCPLCGEEARLVINGAWEGGGYVECLGCGATTGPKRTTPEAREAWNCRAAITQQAQASAKEGGAA